MGRYSRYHKSFYKPVTPAVQDTPPAECPTCHRGGLASNQLHARNGRPRRGAFRVYGLEKHRTPRKKWKMGRTWWECPDSWHQTAPYRYRPPAETVEPTRPPEWQQKDIEGGEKRRKAKAKLQKERHNKQKR